MKRVLTLIAVSLTVAGCGSVSSTPSQPQWATQMQQKVDKLNGCITASDNYRNMDVYSQCMGR